MIFKGDSLPVLSSGESVALALQERRRRGRWHRSVDWPPLLVIVGVICYVDSQLGNVHILRKLVFGLPILTGLAAVAHWQKYRSGDHPVFPALLVLFLLWVSVSYAWTVDQHDSKRQILEYLSYALTGYFLAATLHKEQLVRVFAIATKVFIAITSVMLVVAYHAAIKPAVDDAPGWHGPFGHKNQLGFLMATGLVALVCEKSGARRRLWIALGIVILLGSESGAGLSVTLFTLAVEVWLRQLRDIPARATRLAFKAVSVCLTLGGAFFLLTDFPAATALLGKNSTLTGRTKIWDSVISAIDTRPFHGFGYAGVWLNKTGETAHLWSAIGFHAFEAHETYLDLLLQLGVVGLGLMVALMLSVFIRMVPGLAQASSADRWITLTLLAFVVEGVVETDLFDQGILTIAALTTAAIVAKGHRRSPSILSGSP